MAVSATVELASLVGDTTSGYKCDVDDRHFGLNVRDKRRMPRVWRLREL
jgi:hypothetical protein